MVRHVPLSVERFDRAVYVSGSRIIVIGNDHAAVGIRAERIFGRHIPHQRRNRAVAFDIAFILNIDVIVNTVAFPQRRPFERLVADRHILRHVAAGFGHHPRVVRRVEPADKEFRTRQVHLAVIVDQYARIDLRDGLAVQRYESDVAERPCRARPLGDIHRLAVAAKQQVILVFFGRAFEDVRRPQPPRISADLRRNTVDRDADARVRPVDQVVGIDHMVVGRTEIPFAVRQKTVRHVPRPENIHPPVENVRLAVGDKQSPRRRQDRILSLVTDRHDAFGFRTGR